MGQVLHFDQLWKDVDSKIFAKQRLQIVLLMTINVMGLLNWLSHSWDDNLRNKEKDLELQNAFLKNPAIIKLFPQVYGLGLKHEGPSRTSGSDPDTDAPYLNYYNFSNPGDYALLFDARLRFSTRGQPSEGGIFLSFKNLAKQGLDLGVSNSFETFTKQGIHLGLRDRTVPLVYVKKGSVYIYNNKLIGKLIREDKSSNIESIIETKNKERYWVKYYKFNFKNTFWTRTLDKVEFYKRSNLGETLPVICQLKSSEGNVSTVYHYPWELRKNIDKRNRDLKFFIHYIIEMEKPKVELDQFALMYGIILNHLNAKGFHTGCIKGGSL
jgi:hypothetical protein